VDSSQEYLSKIGRFDVIIDTPAPGDSMEKTLPLPQSLPGGSSWWPAVAWKAVSILNARHMFEGEGKTIKATQGGGFRPELDIRDTSACGKRAC